MSVHYALITDDRTHELTTTNTSNPPTPTPPTVPLTRSEQFITAAVFLFPALALTVPDGYSIGAVALLIAAITHLVANRRTWAQHPPLPGAVRAVIAFMILYALFWMGDAALRGEGVREFDRPSRFLLAAFCLSVFARARIQQGALWLGLAVGGIGAGGVALWQRMIEGIPRPSGFSQIIQFSNASVLIGLMCMAGLLWAMRLPTDHNRPNVQRTLLIVTLIVGAGGGLIGALLPSTRGAWLAFAPALLIGLWVTGSLGRGRRLMLITATMILLTTAATYLLSTASTDTPPPGNTADTTAAAAPEHPLAPAVRARSVELRLEMWKGAWQLIQARPMLGWGELGYVSKTGSLGAAGVIDPVAADFTHAHNEWLNVMAKKGIVGATILLGLYLSPLIVFSGVYRRGERDRREGLAGRIALPTAGLIFTLGLMATGMTQVNFNHNIGVMVYAFMTAVLVGAVSDANESRAS
ncbi:hypothetical protein BA897_00805 [Spiribacter roseus]|nr:MULTISPECIES: O-antigen ligase family protein [Spiribacter]KAF0279286.1 hypothetical protein BA897_00805 [Spiribacter roseus]